MSRVTHLLIHRATLLRKNPADAGGGIFPDNPQPVKPLRTRVWAANGTELLRAQQLQVEASHVAYFEPQEDVRLDDRLELGPENANAAGTYRLTAVLPPSLPHHQKLLCERVRTGAAS